MASVGVIGSGRPPKNIVEFRAGKMNHVGNMVTPDKRKGLIYIFQSEDGLTHFCWKDRKTGTLEDDLIVFPDDCEYKKVTQCKEGSRVYLLKFKVSARKLFFWMQEPKGDGDDDLVWKVNEALNNPGSSSVRGGGSVTPSASEQEMQNLLGSMSQSQLMQLLGGMSEMGGPGLLAQLNQIAPGLAGLGREDMGSSTATESASGGQRPQSQSLLKVKKTNNTPTAPAPKTASSTTGTPAQAPIQLEDLQSILNRIQPGGSAAAVQVDLTAGINSEAIRRITTCPTTVKKLVPLLPQFGGPEGVEGEGNAPEVEETLKSPQFQSALTAFCAAFPTGQLGPLIAQFGFSADAVTAAQNGNLEGFINALEAETGGETAPQGSDVVEDMSVD